MQLILESIYKYERVNHKFPERLQDLIPTYVQSIPKDWLGKELLYSTNDQDGFILSYYLRPNYGCAYNDKSRNWNCGFGDLSLSEFDQVFLGSKKQLK
jgi:hypothetical protein